MRMPPAITSARPATTKSASASLSLEQARTIAVHAAGHATPAASATEVLTALGIVQLDAINAVGRAHELTLATRVTGLTTTTVDQALWGPGRSPVAFEFPAHAAALVPLHDWALWEFRREHTRRRTDWETDPAHLERLIKQVERDGPQTMTELRGGEKASSGWGWGPVKLAVEFLVWTGGLVCARRQDWNRVFDLPERVVPAPYQQPIDETEAIAQLITKAGRVLGVATLDDLADYLRIHKAVAAPAIVDTVLEPVTVQGWKPQAWVHPDMLSKADIPVTGSRFLGPFDNLIWYRKRLTRLWGFDHALEAYKPATKRVHGYYALPLLNGNRLFGRADCKIIGTDLQLLSLSLEPGDQRLLDDAVDAGLEHLMQLTGTTSVTGR